MAEYKALILESGPEGAGMLERMLSREGLQRDEDYLLVDSIESLRECVAKGARAKHYFLEDRMPQCAGGEIVSRFHRAYQIIDGGNHDVFYTGSSPDTSMQTYLTHSHVIRITKEEIPRTIVAGRYAGGPKNPPSAA